MSLDEPAPARGPLISRVVGCLVWWPLASLVSLVLFPRLDGIGISGGVLLALRLAHLSWGALDVEEPAGYGAAARIRSSRPG